MNYLDLVNNVLRRMREPTVTGVNDNTLSALVGTLVNDAKRQVEDSWDWSALRTQITVPTVSGTSQYSLTGTQNRATIIDAYNDTSNWWMQPRSQMWGRQQDLSQTTPAAGPVWYTTNEPDSSGDTQVTFYPEPNGVFSIVFSVVQRAADLSAEGDEIDIPAQPVIQLAYALSARERGEVGGTSAAEVFGTARRVLSDAIAFDSALNPTDVIWYQV